MDVDSQLDLYLSYACNRIAGWIYMCPYPVMALGKGGNVGV